jgi:hypothetical protein
VTVAAAVGLLATLAAILVATLTPSGASNTLTGGFWCFQCGDAPLANLLRNVILFLPSGFFGFVVLRRTFGGLGRRGLGRRRAVAVVTVMGAALSGGVETLQLFIPGRNPFVVDFLANTTGAALGGLLVATMPAWLRAAGPARRRLFGAVLAGALLLAVAPAWLLVPAPPHEAPWMQWNPPLGRVGPYAGSIVDARIGPVPLPAGPIPTAVDLPGRLRAGQTVTLTFQAATPVEESRGLFRINSVADGKVALAASVFGTTLLASVGYRADWIGLTRPRVRAPGLLAGFTPGDTVALALTILEDGTLRLETEATTRQEDGAARHEDGAARHEDGAARHEDGAARHEDGAARHEAPGANPSMGWSLLYYPSGIGTWGTVALGFLWCGMLLFAPAFLAPTRVAAAASGAAVLMVLAASPAIVLLLAPLPTAGWTGAITGWLLAHAARTRWTPLPAPDRPPTRP